MVRGIFTLLLSAFCIAVYAEDRHVVEVERFTMIDVGQGIQAKVVCGDSNSVSAETTQEMFEKMALKSEGGVLKVSRGMSFAMFKSIKELIPVVITTASPVSTLEVSSVSRLEVDGCAIDEDELKVSVQSGGEMIVKGETELLHLDVGGKGNFNSAFHASDLSVDHAVIEVSSGSITGLCKAEKIDGKASTKAQVLTAKDSEMQIKLSTGAEVSHTGC